MFGLKYGTRPAEEVIQELGEYVLPHFPYKYIKIERSGI